MDNYTPSSRVLVTGANGHVAQHVVSQLLSRPEPERPIVRATVRSEHSAAGLRKIFTRDIDNGTLELVYIPDIAKPGAFDQAVNDCTYIAHIASPLIVGATNVEQDVLIPAVQGTTSLLASAKSVSTLKAIVITGSFASVIDPMYDLRPGYIYSQKDWNPITYEKAADPKLDLSVWPERYRNFITYMASKKLAETAAWDLFREIQPEWRLSVVCPTYIGGPSILPLAKGADSLSFSTGLIWNVATSKPDDKLPVVDFPNWIDVRDVAKAHIEALVRPAASGERFILASKMATYTDIAGILRRDLGLNCSADIQQPSHYSIEAKNCEEILGIKEWIPFDRTVCDTVQQVHAFAM